MGKRGKEHPSVFTFKKDIMDAGNPIRVLNVPPVRFVCGTTNKGITPPIDDGHEGSNPTQHITGSTEDL